MKVATFYFFNALNDFLAKRQKNTLIEYKFNEGASVKDAIEAIGIPHTEVCAILINDEPRQFGYLLQNGDDVQVYPLSNSLRLPKDYRLVELAPMPPVFICDVHLATLAKSLRMLGFDTFYKNDLTDQQIVEKAAEEKRIVLTRDVGLLKHKQIKWGYWLRSQQLQEQLIEVIRRYKLGNSFNAFSRCMECNNNLTKVNKKDISHLIPFKTNEYFNEFFQCTRCEKVYLKGSHYERMIDFINELTIQLQKDVD